MAVLPTPPSKGVGAPHQSSRVNKNEVDGGSLSGTRSQSTSIAARDAAEAKAAEIKAQKVAKVLFKDVAQAYIDANEDNWKNSKHRQQWKKSSTQVKKIGNYTL